jgi:DNA polymerase/3'-5' exonuclease PolX
VFRSNARAGDISGASGFKSILTRLAKPSTFGVHLLIRTGSAEHNMWLAGYAISKGMRLKYSEDLIREGVPVARADERGVFAALGLPCPAPGQTRARW